MSSMANRSTAKIAVTIVSTILLLAVAAQIQAAREHAYPPSDLERDAVYITSGNAIRGLTNGYNALAADAYWIRAIQYFGTARRQLAARGAVPEPPPALAAPAPEYADLFPLLDITTSLDPRFNIAYRFGAVFLAEPLPGGPGRPDLAIRLLEKGLRERPDKWEYMEDIGFVHYWYRHDYREAARWFEKAADVPSAPWWLRSLAATTLAQGGDRASSKLMWEAIRASAEVDWLRRDAERRLAQLRALDEIDALQKLIDAVAARAGQPITDWAALVRGGALPGVPLDPTRTPYVLAGDGRVRLSQSSPLWPLPDEPALIDTRPVS
jgi:tetratricopeptide (TPR) repeat protein